MPEQITIWIPNDLNPASKTSAIANHMLANNQNIVPIDVNTAYHNNFKEYYDQHIKQNEPAHATFCYKDGVGINIDYLTENANKKTYTTLLSLDVDPDDPTQFEVLAMLVFKWSPTAKAVKIQAFCGNQKRPSKGAGTKLLNFLKKTLTDMDINDIYLNPVPSAVRYYSNQQFTNKPGKKVHDSSSPKQVTPKLNTPKSKSIKTGSKSLKSLKPKSKSKNKGIPTMTINLRAAKNWKKTKNKLRSYQAITRKTHGKSHVPTSTKALLAKVDKIIADLSQDHREIAECRDIFELFERQGPRLSDDEEDIVRNYLSTKYNIY
jgi:hypothetical protein